MRITKVAMAGGGIIRSGIVGFCFFASTAHAAAPASESEFGKLPALLKAVALELRNVRLEVLELRIEARQQLTPLLEQQALHLAQEHRQRESEERAYQAQLAELDQLLAGHRGDQDERSQLEALRTVLAETTLKEVRTAVASLVQRQSEIAERMLAEKNKVQALKRRLETE